MKPGLVEVQHTDIQRLLRDVSHSQLEVQMEWEQLMSSSTLLVRLARGFGFSLRFWRRSPVFAAASFPSALSGRPPEHTMEQGMLAEIYLLKLEAAVRAAKEAA